MPPTVSTATKKETKPAKFAEAVFHSAHEAAVKEALRVAEAQVYWTKPLPRFWATPRPTNARPNFLARTAKAEAEKLGAHAKIIKKDYIKENMGSFWSVAKGSVEDPYLIELSYFGAAEQRSRPRRLGRQRHYLRHRRHLPQTGLNMDEMKFDMCGAATVISTFCAAVKLQLPINLVAASPLAKTCLPARQTNRATS